MALPYRFQKKMGKNIAFKIIQRQKNIMVRRIHHEKLLESCSTFEEARAKVLEKFSYNPEFSSTAVALAIREVAGHYRDIGDEEDE